MSRKSQWSPQLLYFNVVENTIWRLVQCPAQRGASDYDHFEEEEIEAPQSPVLAMEPFGWSLL